MTEERERFQNFLAKEFHQWSGKQIGKMRGMPSQADFAKYLGVTTAALSSWMTGTRIPHGEMVDQLAEKLGLSVYDALNVPRRMPKNKKLYFLAEVWNRLPQDLQDELYEKALNLIEKREGNGGHNLT